MLKNTFYRFNLTVLILFLGFIQLSFAQSKPLVVHLCEKGAPGFENRKNEPEEAKDYWVKNIHNPSIAVYFPAKEKANGSAVIICPGGGHRILVYNAEGVEAAEYLNNLGVTAIVLKYRLAREENSPYDLNKHPQQDAYRAIRLVRSRAKEWGIDTNRVGMLGFSAGGEVVASVAYGSGKGDPTAKDPIDRLNGKPNFQILVYPGPLGVPEVVPADAPPAFMLAANNDECCSLPVVSLLQKYRTAKVPIEVHIYAKGAHAFNMGSRSEFSSLRAWPQRMADWLLDMNFLSK
ncbi:MAG: 1,4-beta-xylanase [Sphingobacteriales bacterium]|nr:1,4-beta-xylanase [Sphingobacteriales bacterium]